MVRLLSRYSGILLICLLPMVVCSCANQLESTPDPEAQQFSYLDRQVYSPDNPRFKVNYASRVPAHVDGYGEKVIVVDPKRHVWGAYAADGSLVRAGAATAGGDWCPDDNAECRTKVGSFRIQSLGSEDCKSKVYPKPEGGGLMPYCMFFSGGQALHGSPDPTVIEANVSHGCVRMRIPDAAWVRNDFASVGTKVVVEPY